MVVAPTDAVVNADGSVSINVTVGTDDYDTLVVDRAGQFDVESHTTGKTLLVLVVG